MKRPPRSWVEPIELGVDIDEGAPLPHLFLDSHRAVLLFHSGLPQDPLWDGTTVTVVDPHAHVAQRLAWVVFTGCYFASLGPPNDEALGGHPLAGSGLLPYSAHEVRGSSLTAEFERRNRVHPYHRREAFDSLRHIIVTFHDETFECLCKDWACGELNCSFPDGIRSAADALATGAVELLPPMG